ncbi:MAG: transcriptional regulator, partial [Ruminiclostridium sp.]|nr:transcriptional regulator [Ruminiclostridium sp.]
VVYTPTGKIAITTYDNNNVVFCQSVKSSSVFMPGKDEPKYILYGVDKVTFWGEHTIVLGWYATSDDVKRK